MSTYFPQINGNMIITQLPYATSQSFESVAQDVETGMRYSFPRRGAGLEGYPDGPLGKFGVNFPNVTDAEVDTLLAFFRDRRGKFGGFRFLDPNGNLIKHSEDFSQAYWDKGNGPVSVDSGDTDPFGGDLATVLTGGTNAFLMGVVGPSDGGLNGIRATASAWVKSSSSGKQISIGFVDSGFSQISNTIFNLPGNTWVRVFHSATLWNDNYFRIIIGGFATWSGNDLSVFGVQVVPMKGEGIYAKTPGNYGYHENCRFDTDTFERKVLGPNQNSVSLPVVEVNV